MEIKNELKQLVFNKAELKKKVYNATKETFDEFKSCTKELVETFQAQAKKDNVDIEFKFKDRGDFEFEITFAGDVLIFVMHTNVFEFSRDHDVMRTSYVKEDPNRSYCGTIQVYNFLADSFIYDRENDLGYMIGRLFINYEKHYFVEGKRELGMLYNNFNTAKITKDTVLEIVESAITYSTNFDLLTPPYDEVKLVSVAEMRLSFDRKKVVTGKRLGFRFQADTD